MNPEMAVPPATVPQIFSGGLGPRHDGTISRPSFTHDGVQPPRGNMGLTYCTIRLCVHTLRLHGMQEVRGSSLLSSTRKSLSSQQLRATKPKKELRIELCMWRVAGTPARESACA